MRVIAISTVDPTTNTITCGVCKHNYDSQHWSSTTDSMGNNYGQCPACYRESLLIYNDDIHVGYES